VIGGYGLDLFLPDVLKVAFPAVSKTTLGLIAGIPPLVTVFVMILWAADRRAARTPLARGPAGLVAAAGLTIATFDIPPMVS